MSHKKRYRSISISLASFLFLWIVSTCPAHAAEDINYWNIDKLLSVSADVIDLTDSSGKSLGSLTKSRLILVNEVRKRIEKSSEIKADFYIVTGEKPNAFATNIMTGRNLFAINLPMIEELGDDVDAFAALIGHELAHIKRNHIKQKLDAAQNINKAALFASIIMLASGVFVPGAVPLGVDLIFSGYSRDQEREADAYGLKFAKDAGFNPYGAVRLFSKIMETQGDKWLIFVGTHPSFDERIQNMKEVISKDFTGISSDDEKVITKLDAVGEQKIETKRVSIAGEYRPVVFDSEERIPTLHQKIKCKLQDGSQITTTRIYCIQQEGTLINIKTSEDGR